MLRLTTLHAVKRGLLAGALATALTVIGLQVTGAAAPAPRLWSIVVHFQYQDGFEFDYVLERGVSTADVPAFLAECGRSHWVGSVVHYHCYPVPE